MKLFVALFFGVIFISIGTGITVAAVMPIIAKRIDKLKKIRQQISEDPSYKKLYCDGKLKKTGKIVLMIGFFLMLIGALLLWAVIK